MVPDQIEHVGCPCCRSKPLANDKQPEPSLHAFSIIYNCGSQVVYVNDGSYWQWEKQCNEMKTQPEEIDDGK